MEEEEFENLYIQNIVNDIQDNNNEIIFLVIIIFAIITYINFIVNNYMLVLYE